MSGESEATSVRPEGSGAISGGTERGRGRRQALERGAVRALDRVTDSTMAFVAAHRRHTALRFCAKVAGTYLRGYENASYDLSRNGEMRVLRVLAAEGVSCLFDVGANIGDWTVAATRLMPRARVHSFELVPSTAAQLGARLAGVDRVTVNPYGLADTAGSVRVRHYPSRPEWSNATEFEHDAPFEWIECRTRRGDEYCREHRIDAIDLVKIDTEGFDDRVLTGFGALLDEGRIRAVQFEYGQVNILTRVFLRDFHAQLEDRDYVVGKVFPQGVEFRRYDFAHEDFQGPNFVAVRSRDRDLLVRLAGDHPPAGL